MTLIKQIYYRYKSAGIVRPTWSRWKKLVNTVRGLSSFVAHRPASLGLLLFNYFPYRTHIEGKKVLDHAIKQGAVFFSVHSGPYPLAGRVLQERYPRLNLIAPFFYSKKLSIFPIFQAFFKRLGIQVVALGGAMQYIRPVMESGGSACLFIDAHLPVKRKVAVPMFGKKIPISTGPLWLARTFHKPLVPIYVTHHKGCITAHVLSPIEYQHRTDEYVMKQIGKKLAFMIEETLDEWQIADEFMFHQLLD